MTLHAASRESLERSKSRLGELLSDSGTDPSAVGEELFAVVMLFTREIGLRRAVADSSTAAQARTQLVRSLLEGKVSQPTLSVLDTAVGHRWSSPRELLDGLESLGQSSLLTSAERTGNLGTIEGELFRIARIVSAEPELERVLSDRAASLESKRSLIRGLFAEKVDPVTQTLAEQAVLRRRGRSVGSGLDQLVQLTAQRRERSVAHVTTASELSAEQERALGEKLQGLYGRPMALHVEVDPELGGGLLVRVGDEVIDGSAAGRIAALHRQLAG